MLLEPSRNLDLETLHTFLIVVEQRSLSAAAAILYKTPSAVSYRIKNLEVGSVRALLDQEHIVLTCGGGGIPTVLENGRQSTVEAVIDKDAASALLAHELKADALMLLTGVEKVAVDFGKPTQKWLDHITRDEALRYIEEGQFPAGSMLPKVEAAVAFARSRPGRR